MKQQPRKTRKQKIAESEKAKKPYDIDRAMKYRQMIESDRKKRARTLNQEFSGKGGSE